MYQANQSRYETMKYHRCGASGLQLPEVSLGFWHNFGDTGVYENMKQMGLHILIWRTIMDHSREVQRQILEKFFEKNLAHTGMN